VWWSSASSGAPRLEVLLGGDSSRPWRRRLRGTRSGREARRFLGCCAVGEREQVAFERRSLRRAERGERVDQKQELASLKLDRLDDGAEQLAEVSSGLSTDPETCPAGSATSAESTVGVIKCSSGGSGLSERWAVQGLVVSAMVHTADAHSHRGDPPVFSGHRAGPCPRPDGETAVIFRGWA
jgi:hypothetical protein